MVKLGGSLFAFGVLSFVLNFFGREFIILMWIDLWGRSVGNAIRIGMIVVGLILMAMGGIGSSEEDQ